MVIQPNDSFQRVQKIIAASGLVSRRKAEELIREGKVIAGGKKITDPAQKVNPDWQITVNGKPLPKVPKVTYVFYKPKGVVSSRMRQDKEKIIPDYLPSYPPVYPVGRLDKESEGLILATNDGELANRVAHPSFEHRKTYQIIAKFSLSKPILSLDSIARRLEKGVKLGDSAAKVDKVEIKEIEANRILIYATVHEGRHHLLRRMCAVLGLDVCSLKRLQIGKVNLGNLKPGEYRLLSQSEIEKL